MLAVCALVLLHICIPQDYAPYATEGAMYRSNNMDARNSRARVAQTETGLVIDTFSSDFIIARRWDDPDLNHLCNRTLCVYYRRHCVDDRHCEYALAELPRMNADNRSLEPRFHDAVMLAAPSATALHRMARSLSIHLNNGERLETAHPITLDDLNVESPDAKIRIPPRPRFIRP
jgi:hypothetical protein